MMRKHFPISCVSLAFLASAFTMISCGREPEPLSQTLDTRGPFLPESEVRSHVRNAGFKGWEVDTAVKIAFCESSFGAGSFAWGSNGLRHTGLFQISDLHRGSCGYGSLSIDGFRSKMTAPALNAKCARVVYVNAGGFRPWDCY